jgi:hypothetical protein
LVSLAMSIGMWWARSAMHPTKPGLVLAITLGFSAITIALAVSLWRVRTLQLTVYERGIGWTHAGTTSEVCFDDIARVQELKINGRPTALLIERHDGSELRVTSNVTERERLLEVVASRLPRTVPRAQLHRR